MGLMTSILAGTLIAGGVSALRSDPKSRTADRNAFFGRVRDRIKARDEAARNTAADSTLASTNPPDAIKDESANIGGARSAAMRQRRRSLGGHAGPVTAPGATNPSASGAPRTLLGY